MTTKKRIAIFASVSTPQQATVDKDSLPSQIRDGTAWAAGIDGDVIGTYQVPGHSRKFIFYQEAEAEMDAYKQLRQDVESARLDILWCRSRDRLGRCLPAYANLRDLLGGQDLCALLWRSAQVRAAQYSCQVHCAVPRCHTHRVFRGGRPKAEPVSADGDDG